MKYQLSPKDNIDVYLKGVEVWVNAYNSLFDKVTLEDQRELSDFAFEVFASRFLNDTWRKM